MKSLVLKPIRLLLAAIVIAAAGSSVTAGEKPPYQILQVRPCGEPHPSVATPYAYGWFGVQPRTHAQRHFGYGRNYTEWSFR
jgi:hypothetical protein